MTDLLNTILDGDFMPHGHCLLWRQDLLALHAGGDILTASSYFIIPSALIYLVHQRDDLTFNGIFLLFAGFIFLCGISHVVNVVNIWSGYYYIEGLFKFTTGIVSAVTAVMVWKLMPQALAITSNKQLMDKNDELNIAKQELMDLNSALEERVAMRTNELATLATTDSLTQLLNRREIMNLLKDELNRCQRYNSRCSILMLDIDDFKHINDQYGHQAGDKVLVEASKVFTEICRTTDKVGRYGGEEFLLLLPGTNSDDAETLAERIRLGIENLQVVHDNNILRITCSIGLHALGDEENENDFIKMADSALYKAKNTGKNKTVNASQY